MLYRMYFYDAQIKQEFTTTVSQNDICSLAEWVNSYIRRYKMSLVSGDVINESHIPVAKVSFMSAEYYNQKFITTLEERLRIYHENHVGKDGVVK